MFRLRLEPTILTSRGAIGNKLRHEYQRVDVDIVWEIAQRHLPDLEPVIREILKSEADRDR